MIVVDSSAIVAIFRQETDAQLYADRIDADTDPQVSAATVLECSIVIRALKQLGAAEAERWLDRFIDTAQIDVQPVTLEHLVLAREAHVRFGKGTGQGAALNFGDCFPHALAKWLDAPLLYKGGDFAKTDIARALPQDR